MIEKIKRKLELHKGYKKLKYCKIESLKNLSVMKRTNTDTAQIIEQLKDDIDIPRYLLNDLDDILIHIDLCNKRIEQMVYKLNNNLYEEAIQFMKIVNYEQDTLQNKWIGLTEKIRHKEVGS